MRQSWLLTILVVIGLSINLAQALVLNPTKLLQIDQSSMALNITEWLKNHITADNKTNDTEIFGQVIKETTEQSDLSDLVKVNALPLPRMVSVATRRAEVRVGPGRQFPSKFSYQNRGMPLKVVREYQDWREIIDWQGDKGWIHISQLSAKQTLLVKVSSTALLPRPLKSASFEPKPIAMLKKGMTAEILTCEQYWCRVKVLNYSPTLKGWLRRADTWGI